MTGFLEEQAYAELDSYAKKPVADDDQRHAIQVWNLLGGLEWDGIMFAAESIGVDDIEMLIYRMTAIRDFQTAKSQEG